MKRIIMILALLAIPGVALAVTCYTIGDYTDCDDGTWIYRSGNITIIEPGERERERIWERDSWIKTPSVDEEEPKHEHADDDNLFKGFEGFKGWDD